MQPKLETFTDDNGNLFTVVLSAPLFLVYVLYNDNEPVYVGCTQNIKQRIINHKKNKSFNSYQVIYQNVSKDVCLGVETACIRFLKSYKKDCYNKQTVSFFNGRVECL